MASDFLEELVERQKAVTATGCRGVGDYRAWAKQQGFPFLEVLDWTSSAGDWSFIVSRDGDVWYVMFQENNFPRSGGFTRTVDESRCWQGPSEAVLEMICDELNA